MPHVFIAMNRFPIAPGREGDFLRTWRERESFLAEVPGFRCFRLLQGERGEEATIFISYAEWESRKAFEAWTRSEAFARAHRQARTPADVLLGHPSFEGYEMQLEQRREQP
jgi:heme-degrading monooxygenase HmoA